MTDKTITDRLRPNVKVEHLDHSSRRHSRMFRQGEKPHQVIDMDFDKIEQRVAANLSSMPRRMGKTNLAVQQYLDEGKHNMLFINSSRGPDGRPAVITNKYQMLYWYVKKTPQLHYIATNPAFNDPRTTLPRGLAKHVAKIEREHKTTVKGTMETIFGKPKDEQTLSE